MKNGRERRSEFVRREPKAAAVSGDLGTTKTNDGTQEWTTVEPEHWRGEGVVGDQQTD